METGVYGLSGQSAAPLVVQEYRTETESAIIHLHNTEAITALESLLIHSCVQDFYHVLWTANGMTGIRVNGA